MLSQCLNIAIRVKIETIDFLLVLILLRKEILHQHVFLLGAAFLRRHFVTDFFIMIILDLLLYSHFQILG